MIYHSYGPPRTPLAGSAQARRPRRALPLRPQRSAPPRRRRTSRARRWRWAGAHTARTGNHGIENDGRGGYYTGVPRCTHKCAGYPTGSVVEMVRNENGDCAREGTDLPLAHIRKARLQTPPSERCWGRGASLVSLVGRVMTSQRRRSAGGAAQRDTFCERESLYFECPLN